ncbi:hypothetical protein Cme02nite_63390 [Catellatospora methionotrophica]|uniref:Uncharacterized protein n=1 Tax=Catellatospora methionotrophica TaxID=121620 RepID=A0A8J3LEV0_9ACTN|nr:hypothetical protein Cme02nite_63390 [Catellatospora methionotrophica]
MRAASSSRQAPVGAGGLGDTTRGAAAGGSCAEAPAPEQPASSVPLAIKAITVVRTGPN